MALILKRGAQLIRINVEKNLLEYSKNDGRNWLQLFRPQPSQGVLQDLTDNGAEILMTTTKGLYYSKNEGRNWLKR